MAEKFPARLYDANGMHVADIETDEDLSDANLRERVVEAGGKSYVWNQRNSQWRESSGTVKVSASGVEKVQTAAPAEAQTPATEKK